MVPTWLIAIKRQIGPLSKKKSKKNNNIRPQLLRWFDFKKFIKPLIAKTNGSALNRECVGESKSFNFLLTQRVRIKIPNEHVSDRIFTY